MCGIFGVFSKNPLDPGLAAAMSEVLRHRGPDDEGFVAFRADGNSDWLKGLDTPPDMSAKLGLTADISKATLADNYISILGHRRLSILDLSERGHQPMQYQDKYWIVFNGEIYNYIELREELVKAGYAFISNSDTEVILAAYDKWGVECLNKFNGMWAFVLVDCLRQRVFLARDRFGVKPLYYHQAPGMFVFASEPKAIIQSGFVGRQPNLPYLDAYLTSGPDESLEVTAFEHIVRINPSHYILCEVEDLKNGNFIQQQYWQLYPNPSRETFDSAKAKQLANQYFELLEDAVRVRLRADVSVGSALSGGLDSSSIVYLVNKIHSEQGLVDKQQTFSCVYSKPEEKHCDESAYIDDLATKLNVKSYKIEPKWEDVPSEHDKVTWAMDTPFANSSMSGWHTYKLIRQNHIKVTLEGQGADEQLAGYLGYIYIHLSNLGFSDLINEARSFLRVPGAFKHIVAGVLFNLLIKVGCYSLANAIYRRVTRSKKDLDRSLNERLAQDSMTVLVNLLHYGDRVSMAHSIESRMPFLDYRLAEFMASVPASYKMHNGWTKYVARLAFDGLLPDEICWRKDKMGWPVPEKIWMGGPLKEWFRKSLQGSKLVERALAGKTVIEPDNLPRSFYYLNLAAWEKKFKVQIKL
jgi:asparagine synthase (glutamine-hydrolysing)